MSDIPDWLVELAAQGSSDEEEQPEAELAPEALADESADTFGFAAEPETVVEPMMYEETSDVDATSDDLMAALRGQVEVEDVDEEMPAAEEMPRRSPALRLPGLLPWQQLVLTILLFLDVIVIGLLILVMLGRVSLP